MKLTYTLTEIKALESFSKRYADSLKDNDRRNSLTYRVAALETIMENGLSLTEASKLFALFISDGLVTQSYYDGFIKLTKFGEFILAYARNNVEISIPELDSII